MDQSELRQWEQRCIQEEPPECTAACPLHVDVRGFIGHVVQGRWNAGWLVLARTLPLAGLLGRVCDAPCQDRCKRTSVGGAIHIGELERACVTHADAPYPPRPALPNKKQRIAVVGDGWSGLTTVWDLARKGYDVTVYAPGNPPGQTLLARHSPLLTQPLIDTPLALLRQWGVRFETSPAHAQGDFLRGLQEGFDALYLDLTTLPEPDLDLMRNADGAVQFTPMTHETCIPGVFAGGSAQSTIIQAAQGRWAATSIDRSLQKVSLTAGREREGPIPTRLYTPLDDVSPEPPVTPTDPRQGYTPDEATAEARRCLQCACLCCVKVCPYLEAFGAYPRKYAREIYNNAAIVMGPRAANRLINACSLCGLCEAVCPEGFAMQELCLHARQQMVQTGKMPPSAHAFALADMAFSQSDAFFLIRHAPGTEQSRYLLFPGCQLCASAPDQVTALYSHLRTRLDGGVGLALGCCGAPAHWAGRQAERDAAMAIWRLKWAETGRPHLIFACATCHRMFRDQWPEAPVQSLWQTLQRTGLPATVGRRGLAPLAVHDPCTTRDQPEVQETVRAILDALGVTVAELPLSRSLTECCGFGGLMENAHPQIAQTVIERRAALSDDDYLVYCAMCRDRLAAVGKRSLHLLDLLFPGDNDPAGRPRPGWSQRRENRARLKVDLLSRLWGESPAQATAHHHIVLTMSDAVRQTLEQRRILIEDLQQVIARAEVDGQIFRHPGTGRFLVAGRVQHMTLWVVYTRHDKRFEVFNAYSHRMVVDTSAGAPSPFSGSA
jgi:glutamate synthase (NADPH) small chain